MDRARSGRRLSAGLTTAAIAIFMFGLAFFVAINYIG
jgi:hypothetical protein